MTYDHRTAWARRLVFALAGAAVLLPGLPAHALRVVSYNILNYPGSSGSARAPYFQTILAPLDADLIVAGEVNAGGPNQFLTEVLNVLEPGEWATVPFIDGNDSDASLFYKPAKVEFLGQGAFYPNPANHLRYVHTYRVRPVGYASAASILRIYSPHLKASTGFETQRLQECTGIRDSMNAMPLGARAFVAGDLNFYTQAAEPGYAKLLESQANNNGRLYDMLPAGAWHDGAAFASIHTQSPCLNGVCASGAATGGMDDRFDFILPTYSLGTGQGLSVIPGTCIPVGNDGQHLNKNITDAPVIPEGAAYALALKYASDHLPLRLDLQLPAQILAESALDFATVIVGAPAQIVPLGLNNPAQPPADSLNCSFLPPAGFGAPGPLAIPAGGAAMPGITMLTATSGAKSGSLTVVSDVPDDPTTSVELSGTVLDHALASLDSTSTQLAALLDFGDHEIGSFAEAPLRIFNRGYDPLQARLLLQSAVITGGGGRFSIVGGFTPHLVAGSGETFALAFADADATLDSTYNATLTFGSADEPLPGALPQPDLVVTLRARVTSGVDEVEGPALPLATLLHAPAPNPFAGSTTLRLDLARAVDASLSVFDAFGRQVAMLRQGPLAAGRHAFSWDGRRDDGAAVGSGVYYARFRAESLPSQVVRMTIIR